VSRSGDLVSEVCNLGSALAANPLRDNNEDWIRYPYYIGLQPACSYEWCLDTVPQLQLDGQTRRVPMGKGVGGGSLINGMLWNRGGQVDFDNWAELGNPGWSWQDMLPYFQKVVPLAPRSRTPD
jgi:choline dehydrogenase